MMEYELQADCSRCFGLCCVALPYAKSSDFAANKAGGTPCSYLQDDYRCRIHEMLRKEGYRGCTVYECFGAGQKVSQLTYRGRSWRDHSELKEEMFSVFSVMQQLQEIIRYLHEAVHLAEAGSLSGELKKVLEETIRLTELPPAELLQVKVSIHRKKVNKLLVKTSELVRKRIRSGKDLQLTEKDDLIGADLRGTDLKGADLRGKWLIAADLYKADLRAVDFIGADLRDADVSGADFTDSIFLTQAQVNAANGDDATILPPALKIPEHWK
ncbi:pentapeptide repeat-containing protein [Sediminibacillus terrae]|uniref:pentapeptide repeat-containing protein n=1 Tax=Sediminibacillus terrae TaxID=1562106 RepID=UPI001295636B|nr:pentapeptide repeat-containing protein [Sediminibacillus terrae]